jgi:hypothetical protein
MGVSLLPADTMDTYALFLVSRAKGRTQIESVWEHDAEKNIWA